MAFLKKEREVGRAPRTRQVQDGWFASFHRLLSGVCIVLKILPFELNELYDGLVYSHSVELYHRLCKEEHFPYCLLPCL